MKIGNSERFANYAILIVVSIVVLPPILTIGTAAFSPASASAGRVSAFHPGNFADAWVEGRFGQYMTTSVFVAAIVVTLTVVLSLLSGYAFGTMSFPGQNVLFYVFLLGIMVPTEAIVVPLFFDLRSLGLTDTIWAVALPQVAQSVAFGTYWMRAYFRGVNRSVIEAARIARMAADGGASALSSFQRPRDVIRTCPGSGRASMRRRESTGRANGASCSRFSCRWGVRQSPR